MSLPSSAKPSTETPLFPDGFSFELLVPQATDFDGRTYVAQQASDRIKSRDLLLFEEVVALHLNLTCPLSEDDTRSLAHHVEITIAAHATAAAPPPRPQQDGAGPASSDAAKVALDSLVLQGSDSIAVIAHEQRTSLVFEARIHLRFPPQKLIRPSVYFTAVATLRTDRPRPVFLSDSADEYLPSGIETSENLLQALVQSPSLAGAEINLPASRLSKVAPRTSIARDSSRPLRIASRLFPIVPAILARVQNPRAGLADLVSLELEVSPLIKSSVCLLNATLESRDLHVERLTDEVSSAATLQPGDRCTYIYRLSHAGHHYYTNSSGQAVHTLDFVVDATVNMSEFCRPKILVEWHGALPLMNNAQKGGRIQHWQRPSSSLLMRGHEIGGTRPSSKHSVTHARPLSAAGPDMGITLAFTGPSVVEKSDAFHLDIFIVNRGQKRRRLAIMVLSRNRQAWLQSHHHSNQYSTNTASDKTRAGNIDAITEGSALFRSVKRRDRAAEVVCLNADVRTGYLPPGACHNVRLEFLALSTGVVGYAGIDVVDLETKETVQVTDLPDIVVQDENPIHVHI